MRLQPVPPLRNVEAVSNRLDQRHHGLVGRLVGEVAARQPVRVVTEPVLDRLVVDERVVDEPAGAQARLERGRDRLGRGPADLAIGRLEPAECELERELLVVEVDPEARDQLSEQPAPRGLARDRLLGEDLLLALRQQVGAVAADAPQVMPVAVQGGGGEQLLRAVRRRPRPTRARRTAAASRSRWRAPARAGAALRAPGRRCRWRSAGSRTSRRARSGR